MEYMDEEPAYIIEVDRNLDPQVTQINKHNDETQAAVIEVELDDEIYAIGVSGIIQSGVAGENEVFYCNEDEDTGLKRRDDIQEADHYVSTVDTGSAHTFISSKQDLEELETELEPKEKTRSTVSVKDHNVASP